MTPEKEEICRKLRNTCTEHGHNSLKKAVVIGPDIGDDNVSGLKYITAPTISTYTLGNVHFKVARFFEDI